MIEARKACGRESEKISASLPNYPVTGSLPVTNPPVAYDSRGLFVVGHSTRGSPLCSVDDCAGDCTLNGPQLYFSSDPNRPATNATAFNHGQEYGTGNPLGIMTESAPLLVSSPEDRSN